MTKAFVDSSVLFSAAYSRTGTAHDLLRLGIQKKVNLCISKDVLTEVRRNFSIDYPDRLEMVDFFVENAAFEETPSPTVEEVKVAAAYTALKDAPIVAAAIKAECTHLVTYDRKHLLDRPEVAEHSGLKIITPTDLLTELTDLS